MKKFVSTAMCMLLLLCLLTNTAFASTGSSGGDGGSANRPGTVTPVTPGDSSNDEATEELPNEYVVEVGRNIITVDDEQFEGDAPIELYENEIFSPLRLIGEALGAVVSWNGETQETIFTIGDKDIVAGFNDGTCVLIGERTYVKVEYIFNEFLSENYDIDVTRNRVVAYKKTVIDTTSCGENLIWTFDEDTYTLTISGEGEMYDFRDENIDNDSLFLPPWNEYDGQIKSIVISDGVENIGACAFDDCTQLTDISIGADVADIGSSALSNCTALGNITIPSNVKTISGGAFGGFEGIRNIYITDLSAWCDINFSGEGANPLGNLYLNDVLVTNLEIPSATTEIKAYAFSGCQSITEVTMGEDVTSIGRGAFLNCALLENITLGENVTSIGDEAFDGTAYYEDENNWSSDMLILGNWIIAADDIEGVLIIPDNCVGIAADVFDRCNITDIKFSDSLKYIGESAFMRCEELKQIVIPEGVLYIGDGAFMWCDNLEAVSIADSVTHIGDNAFWVDENLKFVKFGKGLTSIEGSVLRNCEKLETLVIPKSIKTIDWWHMADYSESITDVYYEGNEAEWLEIEMLHYEDCLTNAEIHYNNVYAEITEITLNESSVNMLVGQSSLLTAEYAPENATISKIYWLSSDENIITVDDNGNVTAIAEGTAKITARSVDGSADIECEFNIVGYYGDFNGDNSVTVDDAVYLKNHLLDAVTYPVDNGDINTDGNTDTEDVIYLLKHIMLPDRYPFIVQ